MLSSDRTGASRDIEPGLVRSLKKTQQPEKLVDIRERIGSWKYKFEEDHERKNSIEFNQVIKEKFEGVYTHLRNQQFVDGLSDNSSGEERSDTGSSFDGCSSEVETLCGGSHGVTTIRMAKNKNILFPETENVAAPEPLSNAYDTVREGEGGEQEEAKHVSRGQWGTSRVFQEVYYHGVQDLFPISEDVGTKLFPFKHQDQHVSRGQWGTSHSFQEVYYDGVQDLFDISDDVGNNLFDQDQPSMGSVRSGNGVKQGIVPLTDFKRKRTCYFRHHLSGHSNSKYCSRFCCFKPHLL